MTGQRWLESLLCRRPMRLLVVYEMGDHNPGGQQWPECDRTAAQRVKTVVRIARAAAGDAYLGTYLYGSLATGSYYPPKSDIDLLVVVTRGLTPEVRQILALSIAAAEEGIRAIGGVELTVITQDVAASPTRTSTCEAQYSADRHRAIMSGDVDWNRPEPDTELAAHLMVAERRGMAVDGPSISEVFGPVSWDDYVAAVVDDFEWITSDDHIVESPFYGVLNICRTRGLLTGNEPRVLSKEEGAALALATVPPAHHAVIEQALRAYRSSAEVRLEDRRTNGEHWDGDALRAFAAYARSVARPRR